jgi:hypothetical protein
MGLLIVLTSAAYGDLAPARSPLPKPPMVAPVKIVEGKVDNLDPNVVAKIIIPSSLLPDLQERSDGVQISSEGHYDGMAVIAGLSLTAAAISLMFAKKTSPHWKKGIAGLIGCILFVGIALLASFLFPRKFVAPIADQSKPQRLIIIEVQQHGHEVTLILPDGR